MNENKKKATSLLGLLALVSTGKSQDLLKRYGQTPAKDHKELELKLAKLWENAPDKIQLEKELVAIHPHKDFIIRYTKPSPINDVEGIEPLEILIPKEAKPATKEEKSNCGGCETKSNCDGCTVKSSAAGDAPEKNDQDIVTTVEKMMMQNNAKLFILTAGAVTAFGLYLHYNKK